MTKLTLKAVKTELASLGITVKRTEYDEYRVNFANGHEATAAYTDDLQDALGTGLAMYAHKERNMSRQDTVILSTKRNGYKSYVVKAKSQGRIETWNIWHSGLSNRWYGESSDRPGQMIDARTLTLAKFDLENGYLHKCSSAGKE